MARDRIGGTRDRGSSALELEATLPPAPWAAAAARHALEGLRGELEEETHEQVLLLVSELVTNSFRHARLREADRIRLRVSGDARRVRVEVVDPGTGFDRIDPNPDADRGSGWGLFLVDTIAAAWGVDRTAGTTVWFELERVRPSLRVRRTSR